MINLKYYHDKDFQAEAARWWRSLSINEMKAFENKYKVVYRPALPQDVAEIYDKEVRQHDK